MSAQFRNRVLIIAALAAAVALLSLLLRPGADDAPDPDQLTLLELLRAAEAEAAWPGLDVETAAAELGAPEATAAFLRSGVVLQDYAGRFADPEDVLRLRGANSEDQAALLAGLVEAMGYEVRLREAAWPDGSIDRIIPQAPVRHAREALAEYLGVEIEAEIPDFRRAVDDRAASLTREVDAAHAILAEHAALAGPVSSNRRDRRLLVEYRNEAGSWITLDPIFSSAPVDGLEPGTPGALDPVTLRLDLVTAAGARRELVRFDLDAAAEARLSFIPASEPESFFFGPPDPGGVSLWRPVVQQGGRVQLGGAFTPLGRPSPDPYDPSVMEDAPVLSFAEITDVDVSAWPEVALSVQTDAPLGAVWRSDHLRLSADGESVRPRVEALPEAPRNIALVTDVSPSMVDAGRIFVAGQVGRALLARTTRLQSLSFATAAGVAQTQSNRRLYFSPARAVDTFEAGLVIRPGDDLAAPIAQIADPFYGPVDVVVMSDGEVSQEQLTALNSLRRGPERRIFAVVPELQAERFEPVVDQVFTLPDDEADAWRTGAEIANASGSRLRVSFTAPEGPSSAPRSVTLSIPASGVNAEAEYQAPPGAGAVARLELAFERAGAPLGETRTLAELGGRDAGWALMAEYAVLVSGGRFAPEAVSRGHIGAERFVHEVAAGIEGAIAPPGVDGTLMAAAQTVTGLTERLTGAAIVGDRLQVLLMSATPALEGGNLVLTRRIDLLSDGGLGDAGGARAGLAVAGAEAGALGGGGLNPRLIEAERVVIDPRTPFPQGWPEAALRSLRGTQRTLVAASDGAAGWLIEPDGRVSVRSFAPVAKGASVDAVVERFDRIRNGLGFSGSVASGLLSPYGVPGAKVGVLVAIMDLDARLFCASSVMMGFVAEAIERGDDGQEDWQAFAEDKCDIDLEGALGELASGAFLSAMGGAAADELTRFGVSMRGPRYTYFDEAYINTEAGELMRAIFEDLASLNEARERRPSPPSNWASRTLPPAPASESSSNAAQTEP